MKRFGCFLRSLYENEIGDKGAALIAEGMNVNGTLKVLDLSFNRIRNDVSLP